MWQHAKGMLTKALYICRLALETNLTHLNICCFIICSSTANNKNTIYTTARFRLVPVHKLSRESSNLENRTIYWNSNIYFNTPTDPFMNAFAISVERPLWQYICKEDTIFISYELWIRMLKRMRSYGLTVLRWKVHLEHMNIWRGFGERTVGRD